MPFLASALPYPHDILPIRSPLLLSVLCTARPSRALSKQPQFRFQKIMWRRITEVCFIIIRDLIAELSELSEYRLYQIFHVAHTEALSETC